MRAAVLWLPLAVALAGCAAMAAGASGWRWAALADAWAGEPIAAQLRAPRVALAAVVGAGLALAGFAMQTLLRNDLADPYILGVSGGASLGAVASLALWPFAPVGVAAAAGAGAAAALVSAIARGSTTERVVLAGVAIGALGASATGVVLVIAPGEGMLRAATFWLFGGLGTPRWTALAFPLAAVVACGAWMLARAQRLDRLSLGDDVAASMGVDVRATRRACTALAVAVTAACVAVGGLIGFIGLIAPHLARRLVGARHRFALPACAALGAVALVVADAVARTAFAPRELPVGLITAAIGAPIFLAIVRAPSGPRASRGRGSGYRAPPPPRRESPALLAADRVSISLGGVCVLDDVTIDIAAGERVALAGENGAGKTTLLRALAGLQRPSAGSIRWCGGCLPRGSARPAALGVVSQLERQPPLSVRDVVALGLGRDRPLTDRERRHIAAALERFELAPLAARACDTLSGGQWQRVRIARALVARPRALLLDEPSNHLDARHRGALLALLDELRGSVAVVIATHDAALAATCDRVIELQGPQMRQEAA